MDLIEKVIAKDDLRVCHSINLLEISFCIAVGANSLSEDDCISPSPNGVKHIAHNRDEHLLVFNSSLTQQPSCEIFDFRTSNTLY